MKSNIKRGAIVAFIAVMLLSLCALLLVGCADDKVVTSITLDTRNAQTDFFVGDTFSTLGLGIVVHYEDGSQTLKLASGDDVEILEPSLDTIGRKKVSVQYGGFMAEYSVSVYRVDDVVLNLTNVKRCFTLGDDFSALGLTVSAKVTTLNELNEETSHFRTLTTTDYTVEAPNVATLGRKDVAVTYKDKTATYAVTVINEGDVILVGVDWKAKRDYLAGAEFQCAPEGKYSDGSTRPLSTDEYTATVPDMSTIGIKTVTLSCTVENSIDNFDITFQIYCIPDVPWETNKLDFGGDVNGSGATLELFVTERSARAEDGAYWGTSDQRVKGWLLVKNADGTYEMYEFDYYLGWDVSSRFYPDNNAPEGVNAYLDGDPMVIEINGKKFVAWDVNNWHLKVIGWQ